MGTIFLRTVFAWQRRKAKKIGIQRPLVGSVSFLQRHGSKLECHPHIHAWLPDGVFYLDGEGVLQFQWLPAPEQKDIEKILAQTRKRVLKVCRQQIAEPDMEQMALLSTQAQAIDSTRTSAIDELQGRAPSLLCAFLLGFSLHAALVVGANQRKKLERLLRYGMRPPFSQKRLSLTNEGKVRLKLRQTYYTGQTEVIFEPLDFLRRLVAIVPPPGQNQVRFHGVFAPHFKHHALLKALVPPKEKSSWSDLAKKGKVEGNTEPPKVNRSSYRMLWAELMQRVFKTDVLLCPRCGDRFKLIALIKEPNAMRKICLHWGLLTELPPLSPARSPPQCEFAEMGGSSSL